jgi:hypothetical protein
VVPRRLLAEPCVYPLVDFRPDALDQPFGHRVVVAGTEIGARGHRSADLRLVVAAHERTLQRAKGGHK